MNERAIIGKDLVYSLRDVVKRRGRGDAYTLRITALDIKRGEKLVLCGPSGCGKSTTLDLLSLSLKPQPRAGSFWFKPWLNAPPSAIHSLWETNKLERLAHLRMHFLAYILQTGGLLPYLSAYDNIQLPRRAKGLPTIPENARIFKEMRISRLLRTMPSALSVGERQRVAVARALVAEASVILADEPTAALDRPNAETVIRLLTENLEHSLTPVTLILVTHAVDSRFFQNFRVCELYQPPRGEVVIETPALHMPGPRKVEYA